MSGLDTVRIVLTVGSEDEAELQAVISELEDLAGCHPAVLTINVEGEAT